jgi:hypothetical protein
MLLPTLRTEENSTSCLDEQHPQVAIAALGDGPEDRRAPVDICRGTRPSQAPKSLPLERQRKETAQEFASILFAVEGAFVERKEARKAA